MKSSLYKAVIALGLLAITSACALRGEFPSLAPRPFELGKTTTPEPAKPVEIVLAPSDPARLARIDALVAKAEKGSGPFNAALSGARNAASRGGGRGGEGWIEAQMAVSRLEKLRGPVQQALADLDAEKRALLLAGPSRDTEALEQGWSRVDAIDASQREAVRALALSLNRR